MEYMESTCLISIIVAVYNAEEWLNRCIDSIIDQTYSNIEIILVDDGSTDRSPTICDEYAKKDDRVVVIHKPNGGLSDARNTGISAAKGAYIGFVDNDDYIVSNMYEDMLKAMEQSDVDLVVCNCTYVDEDGQPVGEISPISKSEIISPKEYFVRLASPKSGYYITVWNRLYKRELLDGIQFPCGRTNEDSYVVHRIVQRCRSIMVLNNSYYFYIQRDASLSRTPKTDQYYDSIEALIDRIEFYSQNEYRDLYTDILRQLINNHIQIRRNYLFRGKKTIKGLERAAEIRCKVVKESWRFHEYIDGAYIFKAIAVDLVIVSRIISERIKKRLCL